MADPLFRMVCVPTSLHGAPDGWAAEMLRDGDLALLADDSGLDGIVTVAHALDLVSVPIVRTEETPAAQDKTVIAYAASLPLVWLARDFSETVRAWAQKRGPMTLLVEVEGDLPDDERRRIERFVSILGRQTE